MKDYDKDKYSGSWKMDNFPFIPADKFKFKVDSSKKKQFDIVKKLLSRDDIEYVINATDNDREGELISFLIFLLAKNKKPVKRILVNEWTPEDITRGMNNLKEKYSLLKVLTDANSGYIKDVPFFENRINYMKEYHLSEIKYMTDNVLIKRVV